MVYGSDAAVMNLAYGGSKSSTPGVITEARNTATTIINGYLNITADLSPEPTNITNVANYIASEIVKNPRTSLKELLESVAVLLDVIKDQLSAENTPRWANMRFV